MVPPEVCAETDHTRFIGRAVVIPTSSGVSIPATLQAAQVLFRKPAPPNALPPKQPHQPLPPMRGPVRKRTGAQ